MNKKALISVSDKSNLTKLLEYLAKNQYQIISTGGSAQFIREQGYQVTEVAELTSFPEMLGGRVKTLHPKVLGGILARKDFAQDQEDLKNHQIETIDLVAVNLYPFAKVISSENLVYADAIENIDIGGPTLLRSAAKNYNSTIVLSSPESYDRFLDVINQSGIESEAMDNLRFELAIEVFKLTSAYDSMINHFLETRSNQVTETCPQELDIKLERKQTLRYGENPHQQAALYISNSEPLSGIPSATQLQGKEISYNNLLDLDAAYNIVSEYEESIPCVAIIKHNNPCGVAIAPSIGQAYLDALSTDTVSAFGGIVAANGVIDLAAANEMTQIFLEAIIAHDFTAEALEILKNKPNLRLLKINPKLNSNNKLQIKSIRGGYLVQEIDSILHNSEDLEIVTEKQVEEHQWVDLMLAWRIVKHVKSNAIVAVLHGKTIGIGCGQTNRVKSVMDALQNSDLDTRDAVLASDAFFPFRDNIDLAAQNHIAAIIQPGGSIRDSEVIEACNEARIAMVMTKTRHFKH